MKIPVLITKIISVLFLTMALMACQNKLNTDSTDWIDLLSNGDVSQWRGDNSDSFPGAGWKDETF